MTPAAAFELESTLIWGLALMIALLVVLPYALAFRRRRGADRARLEEARALGIDRPIAQYPFVDAARCIGCGACARACPEGDVLGVVGGVAVVINGLRCVGHGRCADACPVGAIEVGLGDLKGRRDLPLLSPDLETTVPGVFVAGELSGLALIRNAIAQGGAVIETIANRLQRGGDRARDAEIADVVVVGAGPAGIAAALAAREHGLRALVVDQGEGLGGTVLHFPSRKMVLTRPVALPGGGALEREEYSKEEVLELLASEIDRRRLEVRYGERLESIEPRGAELRVRTSAGLHRGRAVVLALGRRGTPRKLGVPGEALAKVMYQLRDAESYRGQRLLVVGGGDSAVEAAIGLARQAGNRVTISYRKNGFYRIKQKNQKAIESLIARGRVRAAFETEVESIASDEVTLRRGESVERLENDYVFVLIGGDPPFDLLRRIGLRFGGDEAGVPVAGATIARHQGGARTPRGAVAGLVAALALLAASSVRAQESPHGELAIACQECHTTASWTSVGRDIPFRHEAVGYRLEGMHAVAACAECHTSRVFSRVATACQDCHTDAHAGELGIACSDCHDPRRWDARDELYRAHDKTLFPLVAGHARVDCEACHGGQPPNQYALTPTDCVACHRADFQGATAPPHGGFSTDCRQCHLGVPDRWRASAFVHTARFPLAGAHAAVDCADCHRGGYQGTAADCYSCHRADYEASRDPNHVASGFPTQCQTCHGATAWQPAAFDHATSGFALEGAHRTIACADCHASGYTGTPADCYSCHRTDYERTREPDHAAAGYPTTCQGCHGTSSWESATFDHAASGFPLEGAHRGLACSDCHSGGYAGTSADCYSCHRSDFQATRDPDHVASGFPTTCSTCHSTTAWEPANFNHARTAFPLTGAHTSTPCESCHTNGYAGTPKDCYSCHRADYQGTTDPNHGAQGYPTTCANCHTTSAWEPANFNHATTAFPLTGAHTSTPCESCHTNGYAGTPKDCYSCHRADYQGTTDPNHGAQGYPTTCANCHTTSAWEPANFNHATTAFPLTGAHTSTPCESCHTNGYAGTPKDCYSCHRTDYQGTNDPNHAAAGFPTTCQSCHSTSAWEPATFDHNSTAFPLTGAHVSTPCQSCHATGYDGTPTSCYSCHSADYQGTNDPNHAAAGFPTACQNCHSTSTWDGASFDHDGQYFPIYSGKHQNKWSTCADCHTVTTNYAVFECILCHEHSRAETDPKHDDVPGYRYESSGCYQCHPDGRADD